MTTEPKVRGSNPLGCTFFKSCSFLKIRCSLAFAACPDSLSQNGKYRFGSLFYREHHYAKANSMLPKYRLHKASGQAVVTFNGRDFYLGPHATKTSKIEYDRLIGEWLAHGVTTRLT